MEINVTLINDADHLDPNGTLSEDGLSAYGEGFRAAVEREIAAAYPSATVSVDTDESGLRTEVYVDGDAGEDIAYGEVAEHVRYIIDEVWDRQNWEWEAKA